MLVRRHFCPMLLAVASVVIFGALPAAAEAQLFPRLHARRQALFNPCPQPCPCPTVAVPSCAACGVQHGFYPVTGVTECKGKCIVYYDPLAGRWHITDDKCEPGCRCLIPVENLMAPTGGSLERGCDKVPDPTQEWFELRLDAGSGQYRSFLVVLDSGVSEMSLQKYQVRTDRATIWQFEIERPDPSAPSSITECVPGSGTESHRRFSQVIDKNGVLTGSNHDTNVNQCKIYSNIGGFNVKVTMFKL